MLLTLSMAPFDSKASTACWRSRRLFLAWKLMHWWVRWGLWRKVMPIPSSTVLVARRVPSRLLHCGAKSARRAPIWTLSTLSGWGSWRSCPSLLALCWVGSMAGSSAGTCTKGLHLRWWWRLCTVVAEGEPRGSNIEALAWLFLVDEVAFVLVLLSLGFWTKVTDEPAILSACRMVRTLFCRTLGSGPRKWGPSKGAVLTVLRTCGSWVGRPAVATADWRLLQILQILPKPGLLVWSPTSCVVTCFSGPLVKAPLSQTPP